MYRWLSRWLSGKESTANGGDTVSITHLGGSPGGGNGNLLQYSCLKNPMKKRAWRATVHREAKVYYKLESRFYRHSM